MGSPTKKPEKNEVREHIDRVLSGVVLPERTPEQAEQQMIKTAFEQTTL